MEWFKLIPYFQVYETYTIFVTPFDSFHLNVPEQLGRNLRLMFFFLCLVVLAAACGLLYVGIWTLHDMYYGSNTEEEDAGATARAKRIEAALDAIKEKVE